MKTLNEIDNAETKEVLIQLKDDAIINIYEEDFYRSGCSTCDYGSEYGFEYKIYFQNGCEEVSIGDMYESPISEGELMVFLLNNLDELKNKTKAEFLAMFESDESVQKYILG